MEIHVHKKDNRNFKKGMISLESFLDNDALSLNDKLLCIMLTKDPQRLHVVIENIIIVQLFSSLRFIFLFKLKDFSRGRADIC